MLFREYILHSERDPTYYYVGRTEDVDGKLAWLNHGPCRLPQRDITRIRLAPVSAVAGARTKSK